MGRSEAAQQPGEAVDFTAAEGFDWRTAIRIIDARRSYGEVRWKALGLIETRLHALVFTRRHGRIRIISLRKANNKERKEYEAAD